MLVLLLLLISILINRSGLRISHSKVSAQNTLKTVKIFTNYNILSNMPKDE